MTAVVVVVELQWLACLRCERNKALAAEAQRLWWQGYCK